MALELKDAVQLAKSYVKDLYQGESVAGIGLDEVTHDDKGFRWLVTIGFYRTDDGSNALNLYSPKHRHYKRVVIDDSDNPDQAGKVLAIENRAISA